MKRQEVLLFLLTAISGSIFGFMLGDRPCQHAKLSASPETTFDLEPVLTELRNLAQREADLATSIDLLRARAEQPARQQIDSLQNPPAANLLQTLERLTARLDSLSKKGGPSPPSALEFRPAETSIQTLVSNKGRQEMERVRREHLLLGYQRILSLYGKPDTISTNEESVRWIYELENGGSRQHRFAFEFYDGHVLHAGYW